MSELDLETMAAVDLVRRIAAALRDVAGPNHDAAMAGLAKSPEMLHAVGLTVLANSLSGDAEGTAVSAVALLGVLFEGLGIRRAALEKLASSIDAAALDVMNGQACAPGESN